eukprot:6059104-Lingulodinium_polyedra.AAC.1
MSAAYACGNAYRSSRCGTVSFAAADAEEHIRCNHYGRTSHGCFASWAWSAAFLPWIPEAALGQRDRGEKSMPDKNFATGKLESSLRCRAILMNIQ